jgi:hypothetical protein
VQDAGQRLATVRVATMSDLARLAGATAAIFAQKFPDGDLYFIRQNITYEYTMRGQEA